MDMSQFVLNDISQAARWHFEIISCSEIHHMWNHSLTAVSIPKACNSLSKVHWF